MLGEGLPPAARPVLQAIGLSSIDQDAAHLLVPGTVSAWGAAALVETDYMNSVYGAGLRLDRARFDAWLRERAAAAGVVVHPERWRRGAHEAALTVDATGRAAAVARAGGSVAHRYDRLVAVIGVLEHWGGGDRDARTYVEAVQDGWWFSSLLPDGRRVAAFHTDRDLLDARLRADAGAWQAKLLRLPVIGPLVARANAHVPAELHVVPADSRRLVAEPPGVLATGDASMAFDPLSSLGIVAAIESAQETAALALGVLGGEESIAEAAATRSAAIEERWRAYAARLALAYADEQRWRDAPFWRRRRPRPVAR